MRKRYIHRPVRRTELRALIAIARAEEQAFFERNPALVHPYRRRLVAVALCQGAALQFLRRGYGVNDFDVHYFYLQNPRKPRLSRTVKRDYATVGAFTNVPVDFIRTVMPDGGNRRDCTTSQLIRAFVNGGTTANARHLAKKAVVGLMPPAIFAKVLWAPSRQRARRK